MIDILLTSGITTVIVTTVLTLLNRRWRDNQLTEKLEGYQHDLQLLSQKVDSDYQRKVYDVTLSSNKRHEIYRELYSQVLMAMHKLDIAIYVNQKNPADFTLEELNEILIYSKLDTVERLAGIEKDRKTMLEDMQEVKEATELLIAAHTKILETEKYCVKSEFYTSQDVSDLLKSTVNKLHTILLQEKDMEKVEEKEEVVEVIRQGQKGIRKEVTEEVTLLKEVMQREVSVG